MLTGIGRRELDDVLDLLMGVRKRFGRTFSLTIVVIDYFDRIRESCGDAVVGPLLKTVAKIIGDSVRQGDYVARWKDDAFAVVLPETALNDAREFCRRVQEAARHNKQLDVELRVSVGATEVEPADDILQLLARAEEDVS